MKHPARILTTTLGLALCMLAAMPALAAENEAATPQEQAPAMAEAVALAATPEAAPEASAEEVISPMSFDLKGMTAPSTGIVWNPCYTFDNNPPGCYRTWSPQTFCCKGSGINGCYDVCY